MAIKNKNSGAYIKLDLGSCYADVNGMHVSYTIYKSKEEREFEKQRKSEIERFSKSVNSFILKSRRSIEEKVNELVKSGVPETEEDFIKMLPKELIKEIELIDSIDNEFRVIMEFTEISDGQDVFSGKINNIKFFTEHGYNSEWLKIPIRLKNSSTVLSSFVTGKAINTVNMYKELKNVFKKEEYIDC